MNANQTTIQVDRSGIGHNWVNVPLNEVRWEVAEEIAENPPTDEWTYIQIGLGDSCQHYRYTRGEA